MNKKNKLLLTLSLAFVGSVLVAGCDLYGNGEKYTVSFETNGGTAVQSITYDWGKEVVLPANPTRTGYTFAGWYQDEYCTIPFEGISKINQDVKLYAAWTVNQYTVSFNSKGGSEISPITDNFGTKLTVTKPTLDGYTFAGWYLEESLTNTWNGTVLGKDTTVYAKWDANTVTFRFSNNASNAQGEMANQKFKTGEEGNKLRANAYTRSGYTFKGWATSENGEIAYQNENSISSIIGSDLSGKTITLYAIWEANKYDVTFSVGNEQVSKKQLAYGSEIEYPQTNPSKDGYEFTGWGVYAKTADTTFDGSKVYYDNVGTELEPVYQVAIVTENASISGNYYEIVPYTTNVVPLNGINLYARFIRNRYQVTYNTNGGEEIATSNMFYGSSLFLPTPTKAGYTFAGWFEDEELSTAFTGVNVPSRNLTLYAKWNASNCSVNFNTNGGSTIDTVNGLFGTNFVRPEDPTRAGYTFMGWYKDAELTNEYVFDKFDGNRTLYAKWDINQYTITFEENGGNEVTNITGDYNTSISEPTRPTRIGYEFAGWYKDAEFTQAYAFTKLTEDITLYAKWEANEYTITFEENGGSNVTNIVAAYDASIVAPTNPTRVGYSFGGWYSDLELQNAYTFDKMPLNGMTLYAKWNPNTNTAYVVKHQKETLSGTFEDADVEDLTGSTEALTEAAAKEYTGFELQSAISQVVIAGDGSTVVVVKYVRKTYNVAFVDADDPLTILKVVSVKYGGTIGTIPTDIHKEGNKEEYKVGSETFNASTVIEDDTTVTVKFIAVGLGIIFTDDSATDITEIEEGATIPTIQNPSRTGYEFGGWLDNNGDAFTFPSTMPDHTIEVHAKWNVITYVIEFDSNEGSAVSNIVADYDASITAPENPTRVGYTFGGWFTDDDTFANQYSIGTKMTNVNDDSTHKLVLHAKWTINQYTITFEEDGGSEVTNITQDYNSTVVAPTSPTKQGHTFAGWYSDQACQNEYVFDKMPLDGITLYAKWNINQYTITFEENGGSEVTNITQDYNSTVTQPVDPTRTGYTFAGWYSNEELTSAYVFGQLKQDTTVYAKWQANEYNVLYELNDGSQGAGAPNHYVYDADTTLVAPTKLGNTFEGWYLESDFSGTAITKLDKETYTSNITLYAKWSRNTYTIAFETNGGSSVTSRQGLFGDEYEAVVNPTKATDDSYMYTFAGWYKDAELTQYYGTNISGTIPATDNATNTLTLYAKWDKASYTIKFMNKAGGEEIYSREANGTTPYFEEYAYNLYRDTVTYQFINKALTDAIQYEATGKTDATLSIGYGIVKSYFGCLLQNYPAAADVNTFKNYVYAASEGAVDFATIDYLVPGTSDTAFYALSRFTLANDYTYILAVFNFDTVQEAPSVETNDRLVTALSTYNQYKANAYQPIKEGSQFDGWKVSYDEENHIKYYNAEWASKVDTPVNINVNEIKAHSVEFTWEEVVGAGAYLVSYKVNDGEWQENIEVSQAKYVVTGINNGDTVKFKVKATGHDANGDRRDNSSGLSYQGTTGITAFDTVSDVAAISLVSDSSTVVTYNHVTTAEADIAGVGDYYYVDTENKLYLFTSTAYSFANVKYIKVQTSSSQSTVVYDTETSKYKLVTSSGSENIFFEIYKKATGTAEDGSKYYSISGTEGDLNRTVEEVNVTVGDDVTAYYTLDVKEAYVKVLPESIGYGDEITEYRQNVQGITATASEDNKNKLYQNTTIETYKVGYSTKVNNNALAAGDYQATIETEHYYNGVNLGFVVNTQLGTKLDASMFDFEYKVQGKNGDTWVDLENEDVFVYDEDTGVIYFKDVSYTFSGDTPTFVSSNDATYADGSKLFKLIVSPRADNPTKNYVNLGLPKAYKDSNKISSVEFEVEVINAVNVYSNETLKKAYANTSTSGICILSDIEAKLDANQIGYIDYVKTGLYGQAAIEKPEARGELEIVDGSAIMSTTYDGPKVWKQVDSKPAEGFSFKGKGVDGEYHYYYYDLNGDYVIKEAKWETNYSSTGGHFKIICGTCSDTGPGGFYTRVTNSNLKLGNIYQRYSSSDIDDITVYGNYYTVDGSNLPYIVSTTHVDIEGVIAAYEIQSVAVGIFGNFSESTATFNNLTVIANTKDASSSLNGNSGDTTSIAEYMSRTSGGYNGFRSMPMDVYYRNWCKEVKTKQTTATYPELIDTKCSLVLNNVNVYNTLIALYTDYRSNITASYCHVKQTWANSLYAHGADNIIVSKSCIEESGGAAYSVEDIIYIVTDYEGNVTGHDPMNPQVNIEFSNVSTSNFVSGEEQWFKAYSMEVLALGMKSKVNSAVSGLGYTVLQTVTDPNTGLATEKMNLVYLTLNDHIDQSAAMKAQDVFKTDIDPDLVFGVKQDLDAATREYLGIPEGFDLYVNPTTGTQQVVSIMSVSGNTIYVVANPTTGEIHKYLYFTYDMGSYTLSAMMELFDAK